MNGMVKLISLCFFSLLFLGCGNTKKTPNVEPGDEPSKNVKIITTKTHSYCGGAKPTPEIEMEHRRKKVYPNAKIYVRKGEINDYTTAPFLTITTDENGECSISLPTGKYTFVFENKGNEESFKQTIQNIEENPDLSNLNKECLDRFFKRPDGFIEINESEEHTLELNRHYNCSWNSYPCVKFTGNLPPSTRE